ncbi:MAG: T9SS type A sorting domain-containing protein [Bacteroidia bacterium]|nr:T9SS type A sorting domain-containing protein [Bacteroidia bacterium]
MKLFSQSTYTSYISGDPSNTLTPTQGGLCLMGGATENDSAMVWFLKRSGGGDIVVIRASGGSGYNSYMMSLGLTLNSVETLVIPSVSAANHPYVRDKIRNAEALFIAGGNQWNYVQFWKNTSVDSAIHYLIHVRKVPVGGTSAGMAILGQAYYNASAGSVTSSVALNNPLGPMITLGNNDFIRHPLMFRTITDTHYDNPDRRGRHITFLARLMNDSLGRTYFGIACDEYTSVCMDSSGICKVYGEFPTYDDNAYFLLPNCAMPNDAEICMQNQPLHWNRNQQAVKVYQVKGTPSGNGLVEWKNKNQFNGGTWRNYYVINGVLNTATTSIPYSCNTTAILHNYKNHDFDFSINDLKLKITCPGIKKIYDLNGKTLFASSDHDVNCDLSRWASGIYFISVQNGNHIQTKKILLP